MAECNVDSNNITEPLLIYLSLLDATNLIYNEIGLEFTDELLVYFWRDYYAEIEFLYALCPKEKNDEFVENLFNIDVYEISSVEEYLDGLRSDFRF